MKERVGVAVFSRMLVLKREWQTPAEEVECAVCGFIWVLQWLPYIDEVCDLGCRVCAVNLWRTLCYTLFSFDRIMGESNVTL
jgi:hypothetical protein